MKQVIVALDGSYNSHRALIAGADLARAMGRDLVLLYVYPYSPGVSATMAGLEPMNAEQLEKHQKSQAREVFDNAIAELGSRCKVADRVLLIGDPAEEIINYMEGRKETHLVLGRRGLSKIKSLLLGSVSDKVTRHADGMVTVVS